MSGPKKTAENVLKALEDVGNRVVSGDALYSRLSSDLAGPSSTPKDKSLSIGALLPEPQQLRLPSDEILHARVRNRTLLLDKESGTAVGGSNKRPRPKWVEKRAEKKSRATVTKKAVNCARSSKVVIPKEEQAYEIYEPLVKLWQDYAQKVFGTCDKATAGDRILRMDMHGALVEVVRSKDPGLIGIRGILIVETANTIVVARKSNRVATVQKKAAIISMRVGKHAYEVALPMLLYRASERSARKLKKKHMLLF